MSAYDVIAVTRRHRQRAVLEALREHARLTQAAENRLQLAVTMARSERLPWKDIATALDISETSAIGRWSAWARRKP